MVSDLEIYKFKEHYKQRLKDLYVVEPLYKTHMEKIMKRAPKLTKTV